MLDTQLDSLVSEVLTSSKYRAISPELIRTISAREVTKGRSSKETVKAIKSKLHQVAAAYQRSEPDYTRWQTQLMHAAATGVDLRPICRTILAAHTSTHERLPLFDEFYTRLFAGLPPITSLLDLACGFNPLSLPWMKLEPTTHYHGCDIYGDEISFLNSVLPLFAVDGSASVRDLLTSVPIQQVDVALLLKSIPCLEQVDKQIGTRLLEQINARVLIISYPRQSLGGRNRGMTINYEAHFHALIAPFSWHFDKIEFRNELVFRIFK